MTEASPLTRAGAPGNPIVAAESPFAREMRGIAFVFAAMVAWSLTGFFTRSVSTDLWTTMAYRSFFGGLVLTALLVQRERGRWLAAFRAMDRHAVLLGVMQFVCAMTTIASLFHTTVANNTVIYATAPFWTAGLGRLMLGEPIHRRTVVAALVSMVGVVVIVRASLGEARILGDLLAFAMTISFAITIVLMRMRPTTAILPPSILNAGLNCAVALPFASLGSASAHDIGVLAVFGFTNYGLAFLLFLAGSRLIPAAQVALITTLDIAVAPMIVWATHGEAPGNAGLLGGAIVFAAVVGHIVAGQIAARRAAI